MDHAGNEAQLLDVFKGRQWGQTGVGVGGGWAEASPETPAKNEQLLLIAAVSADAKS